MVDGYRRDPERVRAMFGGIARHYDLLNHLLSANLDRGWRRAAVRKLPARSPGPVLDLCSGTRDLAAHCLRADILIVAAGCPGLVKPEWIKPGACVIDVGVNRVGEKISEKTGKTIAVLRGDVDFDKASEIAGWITPVPGGVGPMTIAMLMRNTLHSLEYRLGLR